MDEDGLGRSVRALREAARLSQAELAQAMTARGLPGIYPQTITKIEGGTRGLGFREGLVIAEILGVEPAALARQREDSDADHALVALVARMDEVKVVRQMILHQFGSLGATKRHLAESLATADQVFGSAGMEVPAPLREQAVWLLAWEPPEWPLPPPPPDAMTPSDRRRQRGVTHDGEHPEAS